MAGSDLEIKFDADISGLEAATESAANLVRDAADEMLDGFARVGDASMGLSAAQAQLGNTAGVALGKFASGGQVLQAAAGKLSGFTSQARQSADELARIYEQTALKHIQSEEQANAALLRTGGESLDQAKAQALDLEYARYAAELDYIQKKEAADESDSTRLAADQAIAQGMVQDHYDRLDVLAAEYAQKQREADEKSLADLEKSQQDQVKSVLAANAEKLKSGQLNAQTQEQLDLQALDTAKTSVDRQFDTLTASWDQSTTAYKSELEKRAAFDQWYAEEKKRIDDQAAQDSARAWEDADREILAAEDGLVHNILGKRQSLKLDLLQFAGQLVEKEIESDIRLWTEKALIALAGSDKIKATEQGGFAYQLMMDALGLSSAVQSQDAQTTVVIAGQQQQLTVKAAGLSQGLAMDAAAGSAEVQNNANVAASGAMSAVAGIPYVGPVLAAIAGPAMMAAVMAYDSFASLDVGAWELDRDMTANLHRGEMVVPENFASGLRNNAGAFGGNAGDTHNWSYAPTINGQHAPDVMSELYRHQNDFIKFVNRLGRNGSVNFR